MYLHIYAYDIYNSYFMYIYIVNILQNNTLTQRNTHKQNEETHLMHQRWNGMEFILLYFGTLSFGRRGILVWWKTSFHHLNNSGNAKIYLSLHNRISTYTLFNNGQQKVTVVLAATGKLFEDFQRISQF